MSTAPSSELAQAACSCRASALSSSSSTLSKSLRCEKTNRPTAPDAALERRLPPVSAAVLPLAVRNLRKPSLRNQSSNHIFFTL